MESGGEIDVSLLEWVRACRDESVPTKASLIYKNKSWPSLLLLGKLCLVFVCFLLFLFFVRTPHTIKIQGGVQLMTGPCSFDYQAVRIVSQTNNCSSRY